MDGNFEDGMQSSNSASLGSKGYKASLNIGGPSEDRAGRIRKGQLDWVENIDKPSDFRSWRYRFGIGARIYLSKEVYPNEEDRQSAWLMALIKAGSKFPEMCQLIELYDNAGSKCEEILKKLADRFLPADDIDRKRATAQFMAYVRSRQSLLEATKGLKLVLLECQKFGYTPDNETVKAKFESLIRPEERPMYRLYLKNEEEDDTGYGQVLQAVEALGKDQEDASKGSSGVSTDFAGGAFSHGSKEKKHRDPRRKGFLPRSGDGKSATQICDRCGKNCPFTRGQDKTKCYAHDKPCKKCGKKGHFEKMCKTKLIVGTALEKAAAKAESSQRTQGPF